MWLLVGRGRLEVAASTAEVERRRAEEERARDGQRAEGARSAAEARNAELAKQLEAQFARAADLGAECVRLEEQLDAEQKRHQIEVESEREKLAQRERDFEERKRELEKRVTEMQKQAADTFRALAGDALKNSSAEFLKLAEERFKALGQAGQHDLEMRRKAVEDLVKPIDEQLKLTRQQLESIKHEWAQDKGRLTGELAKMAQAGEVLRSETGKLVKALGKPQVRGRYGEIQLQRVAEVAGMRQYCDFATQGGVKDAEGKWLRPDMTVRLPNERIIVIDAKTNIAEYVEALESGDEAEREAHLEKFAGHVAEQVSKLSAKTYWEQFEKTPEFVVMFVPGDQFIDAALSRRPELIETAAAKRVILASPSTLIGLLRAVELGWKEQRLAEQAEELRRLGSELHERAARVWELAAKVGDSLEMTVRNYNEFVGSVEGRLSPTLRKFEEVGAKSGKTLAELPEVTVAVRQLPGVAEKGGETRQQQMKLPI